MGIDIPESPRRLRIGVLVDGTTVPRWIDRLLDAVSSSPLSELVAIRVDPAPVRHPTGALAAFFRRVDCRWFRATAPLLEPVDIAVRIAVLPPAVQVDVWLCLGSRTAQIEDLPPPLGTWTLHVGGLSTDRMGDWAVMDVLLRRASLAVELRAQWGAGPLELVGRTLAQTDRRSPLRALQSIVPSVQMLVLKAIERSRRGPDALLASDDSPLPIPVLEGAPECLGNRQMALLLTDHALRIAREKFDLAAYNTSWALAWQVTPKFPSSLPFRLAIPPTDRFWADPFLGFDGRHRYIFFEELRYANATGVIAMMALGDDGRPGTPEVVLERPYHLSFPYVFSRNGDHFMIPETSANGQIELFRAQRFPHDWELVDVVMPSTYAADITLLEHGGRWWMFADIAKDGTKIHSETLHLFHADSPFGPWTPHRGNPVVWSADRARSAGAVFQLAGELIRPSQNCRDGYGRATVLNQITALTIDRYEERVVQVIEPDLDPRVTGVHTFNRQGDVTIIDCKFRVPR